MRSRPASALLERPSPRLPTVLTRWTMPTTTPYQAEAAERRLIPIREQCPAPREARIRPLALGVVVLGERARVGRQHHPRLLGGGEDVDVGRAERGRVE